MTPAALDWNILAKIFPLLSPMRTEIRLYVMADRFSDSYSGGQWTVENIGGFDFAIAPEGLYDVVNSDNYYEGTMNHRTFGVALTLLLYNLSLWENQNNITEELCDRYHLMKEAAENDNSLNISALYSFLD